MATQKEVAKLANVSFITVSRVINDMGNVKEETKVRVQKAIKELNYYPNSIARGLNKNRVQSLAIETPLPPHSSIEESSYYTRLLAGIEKYCINAGYDILISSKKESTEDFDCLKTYYSRKSDGVIILGSKPSKEQLTRINTENIPCVIIGDKHPSFRINVIDTENITGIYNSTKHLIDNGHKRIAFIKGNIDNQNSDDRLKGYKTAMRDHELKIDPSWIINGEYSKESGKIAYRKIIEMENRPTAVVSSTDMIALGVYEEVSKQGLTIPEAISVVGFDGHELCNYLTPPLTTIKQPLEEMGMKAAELLINQIEDTEFIPLHVVFPVEIQYGESVQKLNY